jgi:hypothetical protein
LAADAGVGVNSISVGGALSRPAYNPKAIFSR